MKFPNRYYQLFVAFIFLSFSAQAQFPLTFDYTGVVQIWTVPAGVTEMEVTITGGQGGYYTWGGGYGAEVTGIISVIPGEILEIRIGGAGDTITGGYNGGGNGGSAIMDSDRAGGGGGASDIRLFPYTLDDRIIVAAGGGGMGGGNTDAMGSSGGCPDAFMAASSWGGGATGATTDTVGIGGPPWGGGGGGANGIDADGGTGATDPCFNIAPGGGGGGGFYGGGGGASDCWSTGSYGGGGGSGGSSLIPVGGSCITNSAGGNGSITLNEPPLGINIYELTRPLIYPIPADNIATIEKQGNFSFHILDLTGKEILRGKSVKIVQIPIDHLDSGSYLIVVEQSGTRWTSRFIKL